MYDRVYPDWYKRNAACLSTKRNVMEQDKQEPYLALNLDHRVPETLYDSAGLCKQNPGSDWQKLVHLHKFQVSNWEVECWEAMTSHEAACIEWFNTCIVGT